MKYLVKAKGYRPGILVGEWKNAGIWYVRVEWTDRGEHPFYNPNPYQKVFRKELCKITRIKSPIELWFIKNILRQKPYQFKKKKNE